MRFFKYLTKVFSFNPTTPNGFVKKFINISKKRFATLEMAYKNEIILHVDSLKYNQSLLKKAKLDSKIFKDGYAVYFILEKENIESNIIYQNYMKSGLNLIRVEKIRRKKKVVIFSYFLHKSIGYMQMAFCIKKIVDSVYKFEEFNPNILFSLHYLEKKYKN